MFNLIAFKLLLCGLLLVLLFESSLMVTCLSWNVLSISVWLFLSKFLLNLIFIKDIIFFVQFNMDRTNSILRYLKRKNPEKDEENVVSDSGVGPM